LKEFRNLGIIGVKIYQFERVISQSTKTQYSQEVVTDIFGTVSYQQIVTDTRIKTKHRIASKQFKMLSMRQADWRIQQRAAQEDKLAATIKANQEASERCAMAQWENDTHATILRNKDKRLFKVH
jgi:predicted flavoprotein YhiN